MVEQLTLNQRVHGSSPCAPTIVFASLDATQPDMQRSRPNIAGAHLYFSFANG